MLFLNLSSVPEDLMLCGRMFHPVAAAYWEDLFPKVVFTRDTNGAAVEQLVEP